jgi:hypothetical protein
LRRVTGEILPQEVDLVALRWCFVWVSQNWINPVSTIGHTLTSGLTEGNIV